MHTHECENACVLSLLHIGVSNRLTGGPFVVSDRKARAELGYAPVISREAAIEAMAESAAAAK